MTIDEYRQKIEETYAGQSIYDIGYLIEQNVNNNAPLVCWRWMLPDTESHPNDYRPDRVNVWCDASGIIERVSVG